MNPASRWRWDVAEGVARAYADHPNVVAVVLGGSTARGHADQFSDVELGVFWAADPTESERAAAVSAARGDLHRLYPQDDGLWEDTFFMGRAAPGAERSGLLVEVVNQRAEHFEVVLDDVLLSFDTDEAKHNLIAGVTNGIDLYGEEHLARWRARAAEYPDGLCWAALRRHAPIDHFWRWEMYVERGENLPMLAAHFGAVEHKLLHTLLGLNRVYFFGFKWLDVVLGQLPLVPGHFGERLRRVHRLPPAQAAAELSALVDEGYNLVERHAPGIGRDEVDRWRHFFHYRRPQWERRPPF